MFCLYFKSGITLNLIAHFVGVVFSLTYSRGDFFKTTTISTQYQNAENTDKPKYMRKYASRTFFRPNLYHSPTAL